MGSATIVKFATLILYCALFVIGVSFRGHRVYVTSAGSNFLVMTTMVFGSICILGFYNSLIGFGVKNALINSTLVLSVFLYWLAVTAEPVKSIRSIQNIVVAYALFSATLSVIQFHWYSFLPLVNGYVQLKVSQNELSHLAADLFDEGSGLLKPFGLFQDHLDNGFVLSVAAVLVMSQLFFGKKSYLVQNLLATVLFGSVVYLTHSRNSMMIFVIGLLTVIAFKSRLFRALSIKHTFLVNIVPLIIYLLLMGTAIFHAATSGEFDSITSRVYTWTTVYVKYFLHGGVPGVLFGYGVSPLRDEQSDPEIWAIDNTLVQAYMYCGLLGVIVFFGWWLWLSTRLLKMAAQSCDYRLVGIYALLVQYLIIGALNATLFVLPVAPVVLVLSYLSFRIYEQNGMRQF